MSTIYTVRLVASTALALLALLAALRWPVVRGKHLLCAALALALGVQLVNVVFSLMIVRGVGPGSGMVEPLRWLILLSESLSAVLLLVFVHVMGAELRAREADEHET